MNLRRRKTRDCLSDGTLRSVVDNGVEHVPGIDLHLEACDACRQRLESIAHNAGLVAGKLDLLGNDAVPVDVQLARQHIRQRIANSASSQHSAGSTQGESLVSTMWKYRAARGAVAMLALMLLTTAFVVTPMRSLADNLFDRFSVEKFETITVQPDQFAEFQSEMLMRALTSDYEAMLAAAENLAEIETTFDHDAPEGELTKLDSVDDVLATYGNFKMTDELPAGFSTDPQFMLSNAGSATVTVNTASVNTILNELNLPFDSIPDASEMPEMVFDVQVPAALVTYYNAGMADHLAVIQMESPTLNTPEGLDMDALREDVLSLPGLPEDFVSQLRAVEDWQNTLVIPVPEGAETRDVSVNGEPGLLIEAGSFSGNDWGIDFELDGDVSVVMWNEDGILYIVAGTLSGSDIESVANSLR